MQIKFVIDTIFKCLIPIFIVIDSNDIITRLCLHHGHVCYGPDNDGVIPIAGKDTYLHQGIIDIEFIIKLTGVNIQIFHFRKFDLAFHFQTTDGGTCYHAAGCHTASGMIQVE